MVADAVSAIAPHRAGGVLPIPNRDRWIDFVSKQGSKKRKIPTCLEFLLTPRLRIPTEALINFPTAEVTYERAGPVQNPNVPRTSSRGMHWPRDRCGLAKMA